MIDPNLTVVVVMTSSVTTFRVSTTEIYPRRLAMERAVFPFCVGFTEYTGSNTPLTLGFKQNEIKMNCRFKYTIVVALGLAPCCRSTLTMCVFPCCAA